MSRGVVLGLAYLLGACAPGLRAPASKAPGPIEAMPKPSEAPARVALEPVEAPGEVVMHLRWRDPSKTLEAVEQLAGPRAGQAMDVVDMLFSKLEGAEEVDVARLRAAIVLDAPVDLVGVEVHPGTKPWWAASVALRSTKAGLAAFEGEIRGRDGTWVVYGPETIGTRKTPDELADVDPFDVDLEEDVEMPPTCVITRALGTMPARLVCSADAASAKKLAPFVARNVAQLPDSRDDLRIDISLGRVTRQLAERAAADWPEARSKITAQEVGDAHLAAVLRHVGDDVVRDGSAVMRELDRVTIAVNVDDAGLDFALEFGMSGRRSLLSRMLVDAANHEGPPPPMLARLPSESSSAEYGRTGASQLTAPWSSALQDVLSAWLDSESVGTPADRKAWLALLRGISADHVDYASASGAFSGSAGAPWESEWWIYGIEQPSNEIEAWLRDAVQAYGRPAVRQIVSDELGRDIARGLPRVRLVPVTPPFVARVMVDVPKSLTSLPPSAGLGGSAATPPPIPGRFELLVLEDGGRTWVGVASDGAALRRMMKQLPKAAKPSTQRQVEGSSSAEQLLAAVAGREMTRVSMTTVRGMLEGLEPYMAILSGLGAGGPGLSPSALPHGGATPILSVVDTTGGDQPSLRMSLELPRPALEDLAVVAKRVVSMVSAAVGSALAPPPSPGPSASPQAP